MGLWSRLDDKFPLCHLLFHDAKRFSQASFLSIGAPFSTAMSAHWDWSASNMQQSKEIKQEDEIMFQADVRDDDYVWSSTTVEDETNEPESTWGVAFNYRPNIYQLAPPGLFWKKLIESRRANMRGMVIPEEDANNEVIWIPEEIEQYSENTWNHLFATVGRNTVRIYSAVVGRKPKLITVFIDGFSGECLYTVTWTYNADGRHSWWVITGGERGVIRVLDVSSRAVVRTLVGHGASVNGLAVHPRDSTLLLSASKDESIRMWNLQTGTMVAVFAGIKGHRGEVIGVDFDRSGRKFVSCGLDYSIRIWDIIEDEELFESIVQSHRVARNGTEDPYMYRDMKGKRHKIKFQICQFPAFVSRKLHKNYVDCVKWCGDLLISKSIHDRILLWEPILDREALAAPATEYNVFEEYFVTGAKVWFIRFAVDRACSMVAIGNDKGGISIYRIDKPNLPPRSAYPPDATLNAATAAAADANSAQIGWVRQCAFSADAAIIISVDDNSRVIQYDRLNRETNI